MPEKALPVELAPLAATVTLVNNLGRPIPLADVTEDEFQALDEHFASGRSVRAVRKLHRPLARYLGAFSAADQVLNTTLATWLNPIEPTRVQHVVSRSMTRAKLAQLRASLPETPYNKVMLGKAETLNTRRNRVAHDVIHTVRLNNGSPEIGLWLVNAKEEYEPIDQGTLKIWTREARVLAASFLASAVLGSGVGVEGDFTFSQLVQICNYVGGGHLPDSKQWPEEILSSWYPDSDCIINAHEPERFVRGTQGCDEEERNGNE